MKGEFVRPEHVTRLRKLFPLHIDGLGGHKFCPAMDYESCFDEPVHYFTFLRDPVKRFLSHVNWQINIKHNVGDISYYLENHYFHNFQCYRLAGKEASFAESRALVEKKQVVLGLMERYEESLFLIKGLLPDFQPLKIKMNDLSSSYSKQFVLSDLTSEVIAKIKEVNREDILLYEFAKERFGSINLDKAQYGNLKRFTNLKRKISNRLVTLLLT